MLKIENLSIGFKSGNSTNLAVDQISFQLEKGESLGLVGESGSGKSLTALAIMGLLPKQAIIDSGKILLKDDNLLLSNHQQLRRLRGKKISMIFQEPMSSLNPVMRCGTQVAEILLAHSAESKKDVKEEVIDLFKKVKLPRPESIFRSYPHEISGGQKQRVMIAMAIANKPDLLIADEPTTALDVTVQKEIILLLNDLRKEFGMAILFISHDLGVVSEVTERVAVMYKGKIVEQGSVAVIYKNPVHPYTKGLLACRPPIHIRLKKLPTLDEFMQAETGLSIEKKFQALAVDPLIRSARLAEMFSKNPLLEVEKLDKKFPTSSTFLGKMKSYVHAVDQVSFKVFPGETLGLVGESGCGKTTLGRSILRLIEPDSGRIFFDEDNILLFSKNEMKKERKHVNIIFQDPYSSLNPRLSIGEAIMEPMEVHGLNGNRKQRKDKTNELLEKVGLMPEHFYRYPHEFSGGQRQRIVIARALALEPRFIICDEAVSALDVSVQAKVLNLLNDLKKEFGFTYIFISHDLSVVRYMSDRIIVMKDGKIVETGDADEIYNRPQTNYTQQLIESIPTGI